MTYIQRQHLANEGYTSPKKDSDDVEKRTLPNLPSNTICEQAEKRAVMYPVTSTNVDGAQILSRQNAAPAGDVQGGVNTPPGASVAHAANVQGATPLERRMPSSNRKIGDEKDVGETATFESAGNSSTKHTVNSLIEKTHGHQQFDSKSHVKLQNPREVEAPRGVLSKLRATVAFKILRQAKAAIANNEHFREVRKDTAPSRKTLANYTAKVALIEQQISAMGVERADALKSVIAKRSSSKQTFFAYKSALRTLKLEEVKNLVSEIDALASLSRGEDYWHLRAQDLGTLLDELADIERLDRSELLEEFNVKPRRSKSKRTDLRHMPPEWRKNFLKLNGKFAKYMYAGLLLVHCGLRPAELEWGVTVKLLSSQTVLVEINGAKVRATAGQPYRVICLQANVFPPTFLLSLALSGQCNISARANAMRAHLGRIGKVLFKDTPAQAKKITLSAYHFRHAMVTDLRSAGWETAEIAEVLGESSEETVAYYGVRKRRGSIAPEEISIIRGQVDVPREVRKPKRIPPIQAATKRRPK